MNDLVVRVLWTGVLMTAGWGGYYLVNQRILLRARKRVEGLPGFKYGRPAILYFTAPNCIPCKSTQRPALQRLADQIGDAVQIIEVDASEQIKLADYWGVLSVPTTFVIDAKGKPQQINHGIALTDKLLNQLARIDSTVFELSNRRVGGTTL